MSSFNKIFFRGLVTLLPITITIYILYSAILILDGILGSVIRRFAPDSYIPGVGLLLTLILIYVFGLLLNNFLTGRILIALEKKIVDVPFIKTIYSPLKDLMNLFSKNNQQNMNKSVVLVDIGDTGIKALGIKTRDHFDDLKLGGLANDKVAVYMPFSYGLGGYTMLIPKSKVTSIDMPVEKAMSLAITGWVKSDHKGDHP